MPRMNTAAQAHDVRAFNRFYTRHIGMLTAKLGGSEFPLPEARVLWELAHHAPTTAVALSNSLQLDAGYMSRLLRGLKNRGLLTEQTNPDDRRQTLLKLSAAGRRAFAPLDRGSQAEAEALLASLSTPQRDALVGAMSRIQGLLAPGDAAAAVELRESRPGDLGWIIERHGASYAAEHGLDTRFEAMVARICADFVDRLQPARERCWIAVRGGERLGSVMLVQARDDNGRARAGAAQLRLLLLEPHARGLGVGKRLVRQCSDFARAAGYKRIVLWTQSALTAARAIYAAEGYRLTDSEPADSFGQRVTSERWALTL